eukprot:TRINITY_DN2982_c1_g2_i1.p1 TRINITY_DN2982_c1_g2~~TRINITY_DN2982_c1_g2_i1.p1  ORF type:complete len:613 (+),score=157.70 TRINITY_DN2982_c1_g2_i1:25-1839(+)
MLLNMLLTQVCLGAVTVPTKYYTCVSGKCTAGGNAAVGMELDECYMLCEARLWPYPSKVTVAGPGVSLNGGVAWDVTGVPAGVQNLLGWMQNEFESVAFNKGKSNTGTPLKITVKVTSADPVMGLNTVESYTIAGSSSAYTITAPTVFGARHGLATISQLITYSKTKGTYRGPTTTSIDDAPKYPYRGVMVDVSRNFINIETLKMNIRAMGMSKLNALHLHISDTASFPIEVAQRLNLTMTGAYSNEEVYRTQDLVALANYSTVWGVRLIPEIDQPAHARAGWEWGPSAGLGDLVVCNAPNVNWDNSALEPPSGQFNPINDNVHAILSDVYKELVASVNPTIFHIGGDEVVVGSDAAGTSCWNNTQKAKPVVDWVVANGYDRADRNTWYGVWRNFTLKSMASVENVYAGAPNAKLEKIMQWAGADASGWNLVAQPGRTTTFPTDKFMFQVWDSYTASITPTLLNEGYDVVVSNYDLVYLDCGGSNWVHEGKSWCSYNSWYQIYDSVPTALKEWSKQLHPGAAANLKGFEVTMWTEHVDSLSIMPGIWPRAAALAERLWSDPSGTWQQADPRMQFHRARLAQKGIITAALQPEWCLQNGAYSCTV